jgi:uncharacterized protein (TIGR02099 family)
VSLAGALRWIKTSSIRTTHAFAWTATVIGLVCAATVLSLRYWILPNIDSYRDDIAAALSRAAHARITIGHVAGEWEGYRPYLKLENVIVYGSTGEPALELARVEGTLSWRMLLTGGIEFHALDIYRPTLQLQRDENGAISVGGLEVKSDSRGAGFGEWVLQQPDLEVHDAVVSWTDALRRAPTLELTAVNLQIINRARRHRFGVRAVPPPEIGTAIDIRGDLRGPLDEVLSRWNGNVFIRLDQADFAAWRTWLSMPVDLMHGAGAARVWLTFARDELTEAIADLTLSDVRARLRHDLPVLQLGRMNGRVAWRTLSSGFEFSTARLLLTSGGTALAPADFLLRYAPDRNGTEQGELRANTLNLAPVVTLADALPLENDLRKQLQAYSPRGVLHDVVIRWKGDWPAPQQYSVRGRFESLAINRVGNMPGLAGLSGNVDATEKGGALHLTGQRATLDMPRVFAEPLVADTLTAQVGWTLSPRRDEFRFNNVSFSNADAAGNVSGSYRAAREGHSDIDITGSLSHADARGLARYLPIAGFQKLRPWLQRSVLAGHSNDVRFRIKGNVDEFPFKDEKRGVLNVTAKVSGGILDYAERWPRIENIEGDLQFRNTRMEFTAREASIYGVKLARVQGEIPDLKAVPEVLSVNGEAEGPASDFIQFIANSPVDEMIDRFTDGVQADGRGRLTMSLTLPVSQLYATKVSGAYQFTANRLVFDRAFAPLEQASGRIEFTDQTIRVPGVTGTFLGGPLTLSATSQRDGVRIALQGRANAEVVRKLGGPSWTEHLKGVTDWHGVLTLHKKLADLAIESNLQGVSSALPAPFAKTAGEVVPFRLERRHTGANQDRISFAYGDVVKAELARGGEGKEMDMPIERGAVRLGPGEVGDLDKPGLWIRGTLREVDFDEWLALTRSADEGSSVTLGGVDVKLGEVDFFGRRFHELAVTAAPQGGATQVTLAGRELEGTATWRAEGKGRLSARFKKLALIAPEAKDRPEQLKSVNPKPQELPDLDIIIDQFQHGQKQLGRLELNAVAQDRDWKIEKLRIANEDAVLTADGVWQSWLTQPRTQVNVRMDVMDIGKALMRWGKPPGIRRGTAKVEGHLAWSGSPQEFDYPTLAGQVVIDASNGQFVKLDPGLAKLLGVVSLQSLPRRLSLDFRDVFSEGFAFDSIMASVRIDRGIASTENFRMQGPSARVAMSGDVDIANETQKLRVRVTPHISDSVSIAGALIGGPVAGVAAFLAQKVLKDPLEQLVSFEYNVTGTWSDPQVSKVERPPVAANENVP